MKKRTISKLKSIFGSKSKGKRHKSHSPTPELNATSSTTFRPVSTTPPPPCRVGPPPSPPVPTQPVAPVSPQPAGPVHVCPCPVCGRTFVPETLRKHVKICEKTMAKKRKTFDSSRQRREGTDLEQYLPKNFGLPENSPFLEKSPPQTAKTLPKPKPQSVRHAMAKSTSDLQRCPHCSRNFGPRAFERHVEWCAAKAKILPAAPAAHAPVVSDAKQRLNARTQYKAPLARGRRSSQTRDKSSNSRSASVESSRCQSPPPQSRDCGDYRERRGRVRASESVSSNDCEDTPPHVPLIRGRAEAARAPHPSDASVRARQARLARDLSSSRDTQSSNTPPVQQTNTEPNVTKKDAQKPKNKLTAKKEHQIKKLEMLAQKYKERNEKYKVDKKEEQGNKVTNISTIIQQIEKSQIPVLKTGKSKNIKKPTKQENRSDENIEKEIVTEIDSPKPGCSKAKPVAIKPKAIKSTVASKKEKDKTKLRLMKENSMSLDSLEDRPASGTMKTCQSIGINTELLCVPCVIHDGVDSKKDSKSSKSKGTTEIFNFIGSGQPTKDEVELLYKNPAIADVGDVNFTPKIIELDSKEDLSNITFNPSMVTLSASENLQSDDMDSSCNMLKFKPVSNENVIDVPSKHDISDNSIRDRSNKLNTPVDEFQNDLSEENYEQNYEQDMSHENFEDSIEDTRTGSTKDDALNSRHGSGETYTKFTDNASDLDEFINLTDIMISGAGHKSPDRQTNLETELCGLHTPNTNSIETLAKISDTEMADRVKQSLKHDFSDSFAELKNNFQQLLHGAGDSININIEQAEESNEGDKRQVTDLQHITMYQKSGIIEKEPTVDIDSLQKGTYEFKLPSISESNKPETEMVLTKKRMQKIYKPNRKYKMFRDENKIKQEYQTFIVNESENNSDSQSISEDAPPLKLPRIENIKARIDDHYDPFLSAARQMKELMSSETNIPKKLQSSSKDHNRTLPILRPAKEKASLSYLRPDNTKMMKDTMNKSYQKTPTLQRMKSFGSTNNDNSVSTFGGRCSSFRLNRGDNKKSSQQKLNTTFTKSSKENISTTEKSSFSRNSTLNRSFSNYSSSNYSTPKSRENIPKIATSMYHSFQRTTIKQPVKLDKIKKEDYFTKKEETQKDFVNLDSILADDNSSMTDSTHYIDPRLINENDNLPINVNTILNNPDIISSMESLLTTENLPAKFESFSSNVMNNNNNNFKRIETNMTKSQITVDNSNTKTNANHNTNTSTAPTTDDLSAQYDKIMSSFEQRAASKASIRDDDSLCEEFDLEEFMTSFDEEINKQVENKRTCSSTTRVVKQSQLIGSKSELNSNCSTPKLSISKSGSNGMIPFNKSMSLNFSNNNIVNEAFLPSSVKRSTSLLDSLQKKKASKNDHTKSRHKADILEQDIMQSLKDFDKFYEAESQPTKEPVRNGTAKRESRVKSDSKSKKQHEDVTNGNYTPNGKSNDSAYSSLNRISPSKLSVCNPKETNGLASLDQIPGGSDSGGSHKENGLRSLSSDEFLAMERSSELQAPIPPPKDYGQEVDKSNDKRVSSRASSRRSPAWRHKPSLSSSGSESSLHRAAPAPTPAPAAAAARFCHECGNRFPVDTAKFCIECGVKRLLV